jgi:hypothetical protein
VLASYPEQSAVLECADATHGLHCWHKAFGAGTDFVMACNKVLVLTPFKSPSGILIFERIVVLLLTFHDFFTFDGHYFLSNT